MVQEGKRTERGVVRHVQTPVVVGAMDNVWKSCNDSVCILKHNPCRVMPRVYVVGGGVLKRHFVLMC